MTWYSILLKTAAVGAAVFLLAQPAGADPGHGAPPPTASTVLHSDLGVLEAGVVLAGGEVRWADDRGRRAERRHDRWDRRHDRRDRDRWDRWDRRDRRHRDDRYRDRHRDRRNRGPEFCRSGAGHPQHGMRWCFEKGFAPRHSRWLAYDPGRVVFGRRWDGKSEGRRLRGHALDDVLGGGVVRRLLLHRGAIRVGGELVGEWQRPRELYPARILEVRAGNLPIAEFIDVNDDGLVDVAYLLDPWG